MGLQIGKEVLLWGGRKERGLVGMQGMKDSVGKQRIFGGVFGGERCLLLGSFLFFLLVGLKLILNKLFVEVGRGELENIRVFVLI